MISKWSALPGSTSVTLTLNTENVSFTHARIVCHCASVPLNARTVLLAPASEVRSVRESVVPGRIGQPPVHLLRKIVLYGICPAGVSTCGRVETSGITMSRGVSAKAGDARHRAATTPRLRVMKYLAVIFSLLALAA